MLRCLLALAALPLLTSLACGQGGPLVLSQPDWNFGEHLQGGTDSHVITIYNQSDRPVRITKVTVTCGCVTAKVSKNLVDPDDTIQLELKLDSRRGQGVIEKMVIIETDAAQQRKIELPVRGVIHTVWDLSTQSLQFGEVKAGTAATASFRIAIRKGHDVEVVKVLSNTGFLKHELKPFLDDDGTHGFVVELKLSDRVETGYFEDIILVQTNDEAVPQRGLRVFGEILPATDVSPRHLNFGVLIPGEKKTLKVRLEKSSGGAMRVVQATSTEPMISTEVTEVEPGRVWEIEVTVDPDPDRRELRGVLAIMLDEPGSVTVNVDFAGRILLP